MLSKRCFPRCWQRWKARLLSLNHTLFAACHREESQWSLKLSIVWWSASHFRLRYPKYSHRHRTRYRRRLIRRPRWSPKLFGSLNTIWLLAGCGGRDWWCQCLWEVAVSIRLRWQGTIPIPWAFLYWRRGWLSSSRRGRCLLSVRLRRWVFGSKRGRWRVWLRCIELFPYCWRSGWACRWRGRVWWRVRGRVGLWSPYLVDMIIRLFEQVEALIDAPQNIMRFIAGGFCIRLLRRILAIPWSSAGIRGPSDLLVFNGFMGIRGEYIRTWYYRLILFSSFRIHRFILRGFSAWATIVRLAMKFCVV